MFVLPASPRPLSLVADAPSARRKEIDHERYYQPRNRPERPPSAEPVMNRGIPQESGGKKDKSEDRPKHVVEHAPEPGGEEPEQRGDESRRGEGEKGEQTRHRYGLRMVGITRTSEYITRVCTDARSLRERSRSVRIREASVNLTVAAGTGHSFLQCPINHALPSSSAPHGRRSESFLGDSRP